MYRLTKRILLNKDELKQIPLAVAILASMALIYAVHLSVAKLMCSSYLVKYTPEKNEYQFLENLNVYTTKPELQKRHHRTRIPILNKTPQQPITASVPVVPNYVHYLRLNEPEFTFIDAVSVLSAYINHAPSKIYMHTYNSSLSGLHWHKVRHTPGLRLILRVIPTKIPKDVPGKNNERNFLKLKILAHYGGIVLDNDVFVVNKLDKYLRYEMTLQHSLQKSVIADQIIIAWNKSRFLLQWLKVYHQHSLLRNAGFNPLEYVTQNLMKGYIDLLKYGYGKYGGLVYVERRTFSDLLTLADIYYGVWTKWRKFNVIWLKKDFLTVEIKRELNEYVENYQRKTGNSSTSIKTKMDAKSKDAIFYQMIKGVYF